MKKAVLLFLFICSLLNAQNPVYLKDKTSGLPVAYANIWKENKMYATSDSLGVFYADDKYLDADLKITAVGYKAKSHKIKESGTTIYLETEAIQLDEVKVVKKLNKNVAKLGKAKRGDTVYGVQYDSKTGMCAKYFPNKANVGFVNKVKFCATTSERNRIVNLIFYSVGENGKPKEILNSENKIVSLKKGTHIVEVDVSNLDIEFPKEGIFVVIQHLLLEQNKNYANKLYNPKAFFYEPAIAVDFTDGYQDTWYFEDDKWQKNNRYSVNMEISISE